MTDTPSPQKLRVIMIGVGGATCSGKTTLAKHLQAVLPNSFVVHQDDFAPPNEEVPIHPMYGVQDWDDAPGAIVWDKMAKELQFVKANGKTSTSHYSHDHLNEQRPVDVEKETVMYWKTRFSQIERQCAKNGEKVVWVMVDGFLLYWHPDVYNILDIRIFLRAPEPVLKERRTARNGYYTAALTVNPEGSLWADPPGYWENIAYPSYLKAHEDLFVNGDMENGDVSKKVPDLLVFDGVNITMTELLDRTCRRIIMALGMDLD